MPAMQKKRAQAPSRPRKQHDGQFLFNGLVSYQTVSGALSRFKNPKASNDIKNFNPFRSAMDDSGADDF